MQSPSPGRLVRTAFVFAATVVLASCAARGTLTVDPTAASVGSVQPILVASARAPDDGPNAFAADRADDPGFARFTVSVPPDRQAGTVTFPRSQPPDPRTDFVTISARRLSGEAAFVAAIDAQLARLPRENREVFVFMHGFNTNFSEGLYRQAQMRHDFGAPGVSVHFSWPSAGSLRAYAFDRESALFARDGLEQTLEAISRTNAERIIVGAHSMGALVLMETLRTMGVGGAPRFFDRLQAVVLMSPDLDVDVFRGQIAPLARHDVPVYVFYSSRDRALRASALLRGSGERLGSIQDFERVEGLPVTLIDTSEVADGADALGHFAVATSPAMIALIQGMDRVGAATLSDSLFSPGPLEATVSVVRGVTDVVLTPLAQP